MARRRLRFGPLWLAVPGLVFLAVFLVLPVAKLLVLSLQDPDTGAPSSAAYARLVEAGTYLRVLGITFRIAGFTALLSTLGGYPLAYWLARQPSARRGRLILLVLLPFWTSYLVKTFAWVIVLGRTGVINAGLHGLGLIAQPFDLLHNEFSVMVGMVHAMLPLAVLTMLPVVTAIDGRLRPVAATLGAAPAQGFWLVTVPLSLPGIAAAGLLCFLSSIGFFIVPSLLGGRQQTMLAQIIITQVSEVLDWPFAGALSALLLAATLIICWLYDRIVGFSSLSGDLAEAGRSAGILRNTGFAALHATARFWAAVGAVSLKVLGPAPGRLLLPVYAFVVVAFLILPTLVVIPMAFSSSSFLQFPPPGYGLRWFGVYFDSDVWTGATLRSFGVAFATAILATLLGGAAALGLARSRSRWRGAVFAAFLAPMIAPRIVLAVGLFYLFAQLGLVASDSGLVLGHTLLALPFATVAVTAVLKTYDWRLDQVAATLGASRWTALRLVTLPLIRGGLIAAALFAFITSFDELTIALFVSGGIKTTLPKQMWDDMVLQLNPTLAAASVVILVVITGLLLIAERFRNAA